MNTVTNPIQTPYFDIVTPGDNPALDENLKKFLLKFYRMNPPHVRATPAFAMSTNETSRPRPPQDYDDRDEFEGEIEVGPFRTKGKAKTSDKSGSTLAGVAMGGGLVLTAIALIGILFGGKK